MKLLLQAAIAGYATVVHLVQLNFVLLLVFQEHLVKYLNFLVSVFRAFLCGLEFLGLL